MELESKVTLDLSGFSQAAHDSKKTADNLKGAASAVREFRANAGGFTGGATGGGAGGVGKFSGGGGTGTFYIQRANIWVREANVLIQNAKVSMSGSQLPSVHKPGGKDKEDKDKGNLTSLLATAGIASTFAWKSVSLANPGAMERFQIAVEDTTAVIGHQLTPALEWLTRQIREAGDWLASNPAAAKAIGYGTVGLAAVATIGSLAAIGKMAWSGGKSVVGGIGSAGGWLGSAFGGGGKLVTSADMAAGGVRINAGGTTPAATVRQGFASRLGGTVGRMGGPLVALTESLRLHSVDDPMKDYVPYGSFIQRNLDDLFNLNEDERKQVHSSYNKAFKFVKDWGSPFGIANNAAKTWGGFSLNPFDWFGTDGEKKVSSFGAAARPTQYTDVLSSVMQLRQQISSSSGIDPNERTATATEESAASLKIIVGMGSIGGTTGAAIGVGIMTLWDSIFGSNSGDTPRSGL